MANPALVKELREMTQAGILDCSKALKETGDDSEKAVEFLRKKGLASADKKSGRAANEGVLDCYIHNGSKIAVLLEVNCETDFVARTEQFQEMVKDIAMHIAASNPQFVSRDQISKEILDKEAEILTAQLAESGKPANIVEKIVEGRLDKFCAGICLLEQPFVKNPDVTIKDHVNASIAKIGENIQVKRFVRWVLGEE